MELHFLGGCREVGRSCVLLKQKELNVLFDAGVKLFSEQELPLPSPVKTDAIILSHAHLDHSGAAPSFFREGNPAVFATEPTAPLTSLLFEDSIKIAEQKSKKGFFTRKELNKFRKGLITLSYEWSYEFFEGSCFKFFDAGHILGAGQIFFKSSEGKNILYSGDFKIEGTHMHDGAKVCREKIDCLVIESTYSSYNHPPRKELEKSFCESVRETIEAGGIALVACFALGRTQEVIEILHENRLSNRLFVDGMGNSVNEIYCEYPEYLKTPVFFQNALSSITQVQSPKHRKRICEKPGIVLASAGMLEGGPILDYIKKLNKTGKAKLFLTGYQVKGTNGRSILEEGLIKENGRIIKVDLPVEFYDLSGHAGRSDLFKYVDLISPDKVFCIHGDSDNCISFARELKEKGFDATAPQLGDSFNL